jgi:hypothetical protein
MKTIASPFSRFSLAVEGLQSPHVLAMDPMDLAASDPISLECFIMMHLGKGRFSIIECELLKKSHRDGPSHIRRKWSSTTLFRQITYNIFTQEQRCYLI